MIFSENPTTPESSNNLHRIRPCLDFDDLQRLTGPVTELEHQPKTDRKRNKPSMPTTSSDPSDAVKGSDADKWKTYKRRRKGRQSSNPTNDWEASQSEGNITSVEPTEDANKSGKRVFVSDNSHSLLNVGSYQENEHLDQNNEHLDQKNRSGRSTFHIKAHSSDVSEIEARKVSRAREGQLNAHEEDHLFIQPAGELHNKNFLQRSRKGSINGHKEISMFSSTTVDDCMSLNSVKNDNLSKVTTMQRTLNSGSRRKLLILDLNGLLVDIVNDPPSGHKPDMILNRKSVFKRPFCDDFLNFCFEKFDIGVWSSRRRENVKIVVDFLMEKLKHKLLFCWDQSKCTMTRFGTVENRHKPLVFKELKKIWDKEAPGLPWEKGYYTPSNTLLVDDSPHKALRNPPHTAIFPHPFSVTDVEDNSLGPGGDLRVYLERLAEVDDVQKYIQEHSFGQRAITESNLSWAFYLQVIGKSSVPT